MAFIPIEKERHFTGTLNKIKQISSNGLYITTNDIIDYFYEYWYKQLSEEGLNPEAFSIDDCIEAFLEHEDYVKELPRIRVIP